MKRWKVVRKLANGGFFEVEQRFWTRRGAQKAADYMNNFALSLSLSEQLRMLFERNRYFAVTEKQLRVLEAEQ